MHPILAANTPLAPLIFKFPQLLASDFLFSSTRFSTSCFLSSCSPACSSVLLSDSSHLCSSPLMAYPASKPQITFHPLTSLLTTALSPSVTKNLPFNPHPLTLPLRPLLSDYLHSENIQAYTHRLSLPSRPPPPFPLANNSFSPAYRPSNVLCSTLTDPPVFPVSISLSLPCCAGEGGSCFGLLMSNPSLMLWLYCSSSHAPLPHGRVISLNLFHTCHPSGLCGFAHENLTAGLIALITLLPLRIVSRKSLLSRRGPWAFM